MLQCRQQELSQPPLLLCRILSNSMFFRQLLRLLLISASKNDTWLHSPTFVSTWNQSTPCTLDHLHVHSWGEFLSVQSIGEETDADASSPLAFSRAERCDMSKATVSEAMNLTTNLAQPTVRSLLSIL